MATLPLDVCSANPGHDPSTSLPVPDNDNAHCWTHDRRARALLSSMAARPPYGEWKRTRYVQTRDEWFEYVGYRTEALNAIRLQHGDRALLAYHAQGEEAYPLFNAWCRQPTVTQAIDAVLEGC